MAGFRGILTVVTGVWGMFLSLGAVHGGQPLVFVSSFAPADKGGIEAFHLDVPTGKLTSAGRTPGVPHPFFFAVSADQKYLFSIHAKSFGGKEPEEVASFRIESREGRLTEINRRTTRGTASCYVDIHGSRKSLLVANYSSGDVISYGVAADGTISEPVTFVRHSGSSVNTSRQKEPHAHCFVISPEGKFAYAADLGTDQVLGYRLDSETGTLTANDQPFVSLPPGSGPRHLTFHPNGKWMYVINELLNTITRFSYAAETGVLIERETVPTLPADFKEASYTADLKVTPNGKFLYGTNRGHDSLACYRIADDGKLSLLEIVPSLGKGPQNLAISPDGTLLLCANMAGSNLAVFRIGADGKIASAGQPVEIVSPSCIRILP